MVKPGAVSARVTLYYQSTSKEYIEFPKNWNTSNDAGQVLYDLWNNNGKSPPEGMASLTLSVKGPVVMADLDSDSDVDGSDLDLFEACATGPAIPHEGSMTCRKVNFDIDQDVDQSDFSMMQRCFSGENNLAAPSCD